ncbi:hypothetical protein PAXINDRAFT_167065, partial [Paxillus involutus ATCC 200175]
MFSHHGSLSRGNHVPRWLDFVPHWLDVKHDFMLYTLVRFASVSLLERYLADPALLPSAGTNPLIYAVHFGKAHHAQILLSRGAKVNGIGWLVRGSRQVLPLTFAVEEGAVELVDLLLAAGSRVPEQLFEVSIQPAGAPLGIIRSLFQSDEFVEWAIKSGDTQSLLHTLLQRYCV